MDTRAIVYAWFDLLADFLRFFANEELNKIADAIQAQVNK